MTALFCKKLSRTKEGRAVIGISRMWRIWRMALLGLLNNEPDVGIPMTNYFRQWASNKYSIKDTLSKLGMIQTSRLKIFSSNGRTAVSVFVIQKPK